MTKKPGQLERTTDARSIEKPMRADARGIGDKINVGKPSKVTAAKKPKPARPGPQLPAPTQDQLTRSFLQSMSTDLHANSGAPLLSERIAREGIEAQLLNRKKKKK